MDFDILDLINEATKEADAFEAHPARELSLEERLLYLNGLALVMNADNHIDHEEKEYIRILIKSFEMDEATLDSFVEFAQAPDKDTIQAFFRTFRRRPIAQLFLFDALMMTRRDGKVEDKEIAVVNKIADQLEILKGTQQDIFDLFCHIKNRNWQESALYFNSYLLNPDHFKHLLDYHEVDFDELMQETDDLRQRKLMEIISTKATENIEWGDFQCETSSQEASHITKRPVMMSNIISHELVMPWLQLMLDRGALRVGSTGVYLTEGNNELLFDFDAVDYLYDKETATFYIQGDASGEIGAGLLVNKFLDMNNLKTLDFLLAVSGAKDVALATDDGYLPTCEGTQVSAITTERDFAVNGHPNAVSQINKHEVIIRWCRCCSSGHGSKSKIHNDGDKRFTNISMDEMLSTHGFYLVK